MNTTRKTWLATLDQIARPIFTAAAENRLRSVMSGYTDNPCAALEAFARSFTGIAPWLEVTVNDPEEKQLQAHYRDLTLKAFKQLADPNNPEKYYFSNQDHVGDQPLVDTAFLAHGLLKAPTQVIARLDDSTRQDLIAAFKESRSIIHHDNNWILFSAMVEAGLDALGSDFDLMRIDYGLQRMNSWYKGDGIYGDGPEFANDYYNSFVIQPFMVDLIQRYPIIATNAKVYDKAFPETVMARAIRFAQFQELLINQDGTYPVYGRSMCYRFGAFQHLAQACLQGFLPDNISPAQVRCGLTAVIEKVMSASGNFDDAGFLTIGVYGEQPEMGESYINVGSCYLALAVMLPLGLPESAPFWKAVDAPWTAKKVWSGVQTVRDSSYHEVPTH